MIGRTEYLDKEKALEHYKSQGLDFSNLFYKPNVSAEAPLYNSKRQDHGLEKNLDNKLVEFAKAALDQCTPVKIDLPIKNVNRTTGATLSGEVAKRYGHEGLPDGSIWITFKGIAGQSFGAWVAKGVTLDLVGEANDYVGKGLSGGRIIVRPPSESLITPEESIIVGNTVLYGAISGECYFRGISGERFAVRNSGAVAVVEGTGDHGCEYMTGGVAVVLGQTGRNFAAGMSGGIAYVLDEKQNFEQLCNLSMVELEPVRPDDTKLTHLQKQSNNFERHDITSLLQNMNRFDEQRLRKLIENHRHYTGSEKAKTILENWQSYIPKFIKVMPVEYRRVLQEIEQKQRANEAALNSGDAGPDISIVQA